MTPAESRIDAGATASGAGRGPKGIELFGTFEGVLGTYAYLACQPIGRPEDGPADLPLERSIRLQGRENARVVLRASREFGKLLAESALGGPVQDEASCEDAFQELSNLFCGHLITEIWGKLSDGFGGFLPSASHPGLWPDGAPFSSCAILVENQPVEIRFWFEGRGPHE